MILPLNLFCIHAINSFPTKVILFFCLYLFRYQKLSTMYNAMIAERQRERQKGLSKQVFELDEVVEERINQGGAVSQVRM